MAAQQNQGGAASDEEKRVLALVSESARRYKPLRRALDKLQVRPDASSEKLENTRVGFLSLWHKKEFQELGNQLFALDRSIRSSLKYILHQ
jgi:hypothetical protein